MIPSDERLVSGFDLRVSGANLHGVRRGSPFQIIVDGTPIQAFQGEMIATALLARGEVALRCTSKTGRPRGLFCGMGVCFDCLVRVDGVPNQRACVTPATPGMHVLLFPASVEEQGGTTR